MTDQTNTTNSTDTYECFKMLKSIFSGQPDLLEILSLSDLESEGWIEHFRKSSGIFARPINLYVAGRTGAGKTSLGNILFGQQVMNSTGFMDCTDYVGLIQLKSNLWYFDTPGGGSSENYENITRAALSLEQLADKPVQKFEIRDFTNATGKEQGVIVREISLEEWNQEYKQTFEPDIILFITSPHMQFVRGDREYLEVVWKAYPNKVVFALNIWFKDGVQFTTEANIEDTKKKIVLVQQKLFPGSTKTPPFAIINALTGAGVNEITELICRIVPQEKLGNMQSVLSKDLKFFAIKERSLRFQHALHRIAAQLALYTVNQEILEKNLLSVAASAIVYYAIATFKNVELVATIQQDLYQTLQDYVTGVQKERTEQIKQKVFKTQERQITVQVPDIRSIEVKNEVVSYKPVETVRRERKGMLERGLIHAEGFLEKAGSLVRNLSTREFKSIDNVTEARKYTETTHTDFKKEVEFITRLEQVVDGFRTEVLDTVTAVIGEEEKLVGEKPLEGGFPLIVFLVGLGMGIQDFCLSEADDSSASAYIKAKVQSIQLKLIPFKAQIEQSIRRGNQATIDVVELLNINLFEN